MPLSAARPPSIHPALPAALTDCRRAFWSVAAFSGVFNVLMLAGPLYMLQIYDRVLTSRSVPTLVALSIFLVGAYAFQGALDLIRSRIVVRAAALLDRDLCATVHRAVIHAASPRRDGGEAQQPLRDLDQVRSFLTSAGPIAIVDLPWIPVFLFICFLIHPWFGLASLAGGIALFIVTILTERASRAPARMLSSIAGVRAAMIEADRRNSETVVAMGMAAALTKRWTQVNDRHLAAVGRLGDIVVSHGSVSKVLRLLLQSAILGLGAYLVIWQEVTAGAMIAASIMMGRALAPVETAIANWRAFIGARQSIRRLSQALAQLRPAGSTTALPKPALCLDVERVTVAAPGSFVPILRDVQFRLQAGEALGIVGPSGAGKTSLARALVGIWRPVKGTVRLDGAALEQWDSDELGRHIGFVSQSVELFEGTVAENIARMEIEPAADAVLRAARAAGAHDMILRMPAGYDTRIGEAGMILSAGQRQRIALARALYRAPFLVVLDEPNSNLDGEGELALQQAIRNLKTQGSIVVLIAHRPAALAECDKVLFVADGMQQAFGPRDDILRKIVVRPVQPAASGGNLKVVGEVAGGG